jgi:uncharacterized membrane protein YjjB (DUF3815 family)
MEEFTMEPNVNQESAGELTTNKKKIVLAAVAAAIVIALLGYWYGRRRLNTP